MNEGTVFVWGCNALIFRVQDLKLSASRNVFANFLLKYRLKFGLCLVFNEGSLLIAK